MATLSKPPRQKHNGVFQFQEQEGQRGQEGFTLPGVGVSSHLLRRGVGPSAGLPGVGVASQRLPAPGVAPGVASQWAAGVAPGVASQLFMAGVASTVSQSTTLGFFLQTMCLTSCKFVDISKPPGLLTS